MRCRTAILALALLMPAQAMARDMLPLRQGIFVREDVSCRRASHATSLAFWGNELNGQREIGRILKVRRSGQNHVVDLAISAEGGAPDRQSWTLRIRGKERFSFVGNGGETYRWCFARMPA